MWISKKRYTTLLESRLASEECREKARKYDDLIDKASSGALMIADKNVYCMSADSLSAITDDLIKNSGKIRDLESELTWYKTQYHVMKMKLEDAQNET